MSRARPEHKPRKIACRECGAPILLRDERTILRVCGHCGVVLELTETEQLVLERRLGGGGEVGYRIDLGERLKIEEASYEVIGRVCVIEDGDSEDQTHQYYLYHPRREPLWLSEYEGSWDLTRRTRVRPKGDVFNRSNRYFATYDGRKWEHVELGTTEVFHVDGALPYVQRVGDQTEYRELCGAADLKLMFEATRSEGEVEYAEGRSVSQADVQRWLGRKLAVLDDDDDDYGFGFGGSSASEALKPMAITIAGVGLAVAAGLFVYSMGDARSGTVATRFAASPNELRENPMSSLFAVEEGDVLRIELSAPLMNAWMYAQAAVVEDDGDTVVHVAETDLGYYSGTDPVDGSPWSEGRSIESVYVRVEEDGNYRLLLGAISGYNENPSNTAQHDVRANVYRGATYRRAALVGTGVCVAVGIVFLLGLLGVGSYQVEEEVKKRRAWRLAAVAAAVFALVGGVSLYASANAWGAPELEHPDGVSIRQSSVGGRPNANFFVVYNSPRSHLGGGVHSGK